jgi:type IV pilus assembly protein PilM
MALPFLTSSAKKRDQIVAIDLGARTTKAVHLNRRGDSYALVGYTLQDAPIYEKGLAPEILAEHLKVVCQSLGARTKQVTIALGVTDAVVRQTELPMQGLPEMRQMLKFNSKGYLQQDYPGHVWDCYILPPKGEVSGEKKGTPKFKVLAGGTRQTLLNDLVTAIKSAGLIPDLVVPGLIGPINAFELAMPEIFAKEIVAVVDIGFKNSSISILSGGDMVLSRVVGIGGDKITSGLAESKGISYAEAEGIKIGMPQEVAEDLDPLLIPLGRELRASLDFFEHQEDKTVGQVFLSGASSQSEYVAQSLQNELMVPCKTWNPVAVLQLSLPSEQLATVEQAGPNLAVALGAAACGMN